MGRSSSPSKKTALIIGCSAGALLFVGCLGALILGLLMRAASGPSGSSGLKAQQYQVDPSGETSVLKYGDYSVSIPAGTVQQTETLSITPVKGLAPALAEFEPVCPPLDVKLGSLTKFTQPLGIEIPYDKSKLQGLAPGEAFVAVYYDESAGVWEDVPYEVDEAQSVVRLVMYHLSTVQLYYSFYELGGSVYDNGKVSVIYDIDVNGDLSKKYRAYEQAVGRYGDASGAPQFVIDLADNADLILQAYYQAGLSVPLKPKIYVTDSTNKYNSKTGNVSVELDIATQAEPEKLMLRNLAHELFHGAQRGTMGMVDYELSGLKNSSFWLEASADYMANTGVWVLLGKPPLKKYNYYATDFFEKSLYSMGSDHEYDAANFVDFIQSCQYASPQELIKLSASYSSFPEGFSSIFGNLEDAYRDFMEYSLFDNASHLQAGSNKQLEAWLTNGKDLHFPQDANGNGEQGVLPPLEGTGLLPFDGEYSTGFYRFTTDCDTTLTITPNSDLILYRLNRLRSGRGYDLRVQAIGGAETQIDFGKDEFVLAAQVSALPGLLAFKYKAEPTRVDLSGRWQMTKFTAVDFDGSQAFWVLVQQQYGMDKAGLIEATNSAVPIDSIYMVLTKTGDEPLYRMEIGSTSADGNTVLENVQLVNNHLLGSTTVDGMHGDIDLAVNGDEVSGTLHSDIRLTVGQTVESATQVTDMTAVRAK